jgi:hypothetical protein
MAKLTLAPGVRPTKAKRGSRKKSRRRWHHDGWMTTAKVVFLLERRRRRREREKNSPSPRQIALIIVSAGLAILVIRVASQRIRSRGAEAPGESQDTAPETPTSDGASSNDTAPATESPLTDRVQREMSRRDDAPTPAAGTE